MKYGTKLVYVFLAQKQNKRKLSTSVDLLLVITMIVRSTSMSVPFCHDCGLPSYMYDYDLTNIS